MSNERVLRGTELRYVIVDHLYRVGPRTIYEIVDELRYHGFTVSGYRAKTVADALRWEVGRGRLRRLRRGCYGPTEMPRATEHRIHLRAMALRAEAGVTMGRHDEWFWSKLSGYL